MPGHCTSSVVGPMTGYSQCGNPSEYFSSAGDPLCRRSFYAEQTREQDAQAEESLRDGVDNVNALSATSAAAAKPPVAPGTALRRGILFMGAGVAFAVVRFLVFQDIPRIALPLTGLVFAAAARGRQVRYYE